MSSISDYSWPRPLRAHASWWVTNNPVLRLGDFGVEKVTDRFKIGDGVTAWIDLHYHESTYSILAQAAELFVSTADLDDDVAALINDDATPSDVRAALDALYTGGGGGGTVDSVVAGSNISVDSTDPANPVVSTDAVVESIVAGANVTVDATDPANPVVSASGGAGGLDDAGVAALVDDDTTPSDTRAALDAIYAVIGSGGTVDSIVAGANITVDATDPANPIVSSTGGGGGSGNQYVPLTTTVGGVPELVWDSNDALVLTEVPLP